MRKRELEAMQPVGCEQFGGYNRAGKDSGRELKSQKSLVINEFIVKDLLLPSPQCEQTGVLLGD